MPTFSAALLQELDSAKVIQLVLLGLFCNWAMGQWAPFWQPLATPALVTMLCFTQISTQIVPKCAGEVLNKGNEVLPGFPGFTIPVLHMCSWKPDVPSQWRGLRGQDSWRPGVTALVWLREVRSLSVLLLRLNTAFPVQAAKSGRQTKVFYTSTQGTLSSLFQTKSLKFMPVKFRHEMRTYFPSLRFGNNADAAPGYQAWDVQTCLFSHFKAVHSDVSRVNIYLPKYIVGAKKCY